MLLISEAVAWKCSVTKSVLSNFAKFTRENLCQSLLLLLTVIFLWFVKMFRNNDQWSAKQSLIALRINSASFTTSTHLEVFRFCTRSPSVCCNHSCKNLCFVIMQKSCRIQHVLTIFTVCSKVASNLFAIHWKRHFKRPNAFSTATRLLLSARLNLTSSGLRLPRSE